MSFSLLLIILKKYAWKPILQGIKSREELISKSLREAEYARNEVAKLEDHNAQLLLKVEAEKEAILNKAKQARDKIMEEALANAQIQAQKFLDQARDTIRREKEVAQLELKAYASKIILQATERILRKELEDKGNFEKQVNSIIQELTSQN